ncbi:MAG: phosphate ABC transporter permease PstA [Actinomycetes bacterium]
MTGTGVMAPAPSTPEDATPVTPPPPVAGAPVPRDRRPRRVRDFTATDAMVLVGCALSSVALCWLVFTVLSSGAGWLGFLVASYLVFLVLLFVVTADQAGRSEATDRVVTVVVVTSAVVLLVPLVFLVIYLMSRGLHALRVTFFSQDQRGITPLMPSSAGGGAHAVVGTIEEVGLALAFSLPLGLCAAIFLNESRSRWRRIVRIFVDAMSGLPSVVAGLFIFAVLILPYAKSFELFSYNGFMAALALTLIMLPTITRTVEVVLRLVPDGLREAGLALGSNRARMVWSVVLPTARTGISTAVVLGIARAVGETAPLIFTAFGYDLMNANPFKGPQESLPLFVYRNIRKPDVSAIERGFAGALVLMLIVIALFALARFIGRDRSKARNRKASRRAARAQEANR